MLESSFFVASRSGVKCWLRRVQCVKVCAECVVWSKELLVWRAAVWRVQCEVKCKVLEWLCAKVELQMWHVITRTFRRVRARTGLAQAIWCSSLVEVLGSDSWKLADTCEECDEKSSAGMKVWRAQWECAVWSVGREECSVKCGVWSVDCEVWSVKCEVWSVDCEVWSVKCGVRRVQCKECSVKSAVWSVKCGVWRLSSVKCEVELQMWHVKHDISFAECTHARAWLAHGACKFYRWERSYIYL